MFFLFCQLIDEQCTDLYTLNEQRITDWPFQSRCPIHDLSNETATLFCYLKLFFIDDWKPSSSGNVVKLQRASWILVQVGNSYISVPVLNGLYSKGSSCIPWQQYIQGIVLQLRRWRNITVIQRDKTPGSFSPTKEYSRFLCFRKNVFQVSSAA